MAEKVVAVVPAAGRGRRMGTAKQFLPLAGVPLLTRTLLVLEAAAPVAEVVVAAPPGGEEELRARCVAPYRLGKVAAVVPGGDARQDSVAAGVEWALARGADWILVHDAARPLASPELFARVLQAARETGAAVAAVPCFDTVKRSAEGRRVEATEDRSRLWLVQTPQAFRAGLLQEALDRARRRGWRATDEASLVERVGGEVRLVMGERHNLKVTTPEDLRLARGWLREGEPAWRVGQGLDVHRLVEGRPLVLAGVRIPFARGLEGHSDADVVAHAVMDALLSAAGLGDIGQHFPDHDPAYAGADSLALLGRVVEMLAARGWRPVQVSVTCLAQAPRLAPYRERMRANLARVLGLEGGAVNLAATTSEGLGFAGRGEGMAAWATAVVRAVS